MSDDQLAELSERLEQAAHLLRSREIDATEALALIEECTALAAEASVAADSRVRAAVEPLPDLPGQLPLPAA